LDFIIDYYTSLSFIIFIYIQLLNILPTAFCFSVLLEPFMIYASFLEFDSLLEIISSLSGVFGIISGFKENFKELMAYSSVNMSSNLFFFLVDDITLEYEIFLYYFILYLLACLILYSIILKFENSKSYNNLMIKNKFPRGNLFFYIFNTNRKISFIFIVFLFIITALPPVLNFGAKLITILDSQMEFSEIIGMIFLFVSLLSFFFYYNIMFFNYKNIYKTYISNIKFSKKILYKETFWLTNFLIFLFIIQICIIDLTNL
jgi:NADH:ubiquinone oxidoreductase subunit 2 (subunit N)